MTPTSVPRHSLLNEKAVKNIPKPNSHPASGGVFAYGEETTIRDPEEAQKACPWPSSLPIEDESALQAPCLASCVLRPACALLDSLHPRDTLARDPKSLLA